VNPYAWAAVARRAWYARHPEAVRRLARPVVSVGNLAVGGRGKTPVVRWLAALLLEMGERPAILTRGYGRRRHADGVVVASDPAGVRADLDRSGDEPLMLARSLPGVGVFVSPERYLAGCLAERRFGATVHLLDDGFQHLGLARDVNLLVVAPEDLRGGRTLPFGRLREPPAAARAADAVIVTDGGGEEPDPAAEAALNAFHPGPWFRLRRAVGAVRAVDDDPLPPRHAFSQGGSSPGPTAAAVDSGLRVLAVSGIAEPARFVRDLRGAGWTVAAELHFGDHELFTPRTVTRVAQAAREARADLVLTTEKDLVRLRRFRPLPVPVAWVPLEVGLEPADTVRRWIGERLAMARGRES